MIEIGRIVLKVAGRDAGQVGVIIKLIDQNSVLLDGNVRRRKCNVNHLEFLNKVLDIKEDASNADVVKALNDIGIETKEKKESKKV